MALTVEDGTIVANANTYINEVDADAYFTARADPSDWTGATTAVVEAALIYAAAQLDGLIDWNGAIADNDQVLAWPRSGAEDHEGRDILVTVVPQRIKDAQCEMALLHIQSAVNQAYDRGGMVAREKVGPVEVEYFDGAMAEQDYPFIYRLLMGLGTVRGRISADIERA